LISSVSLSSFACLQPLRLGPVKEELAKALQIVQPLLGQYDTPSAVEPHLEQAAKSLGAAIQHLDDEDRRQQQRKHSNP
jgi:hypothetical protein